MQAMDILEMLASHTISFNIIRQSKSIIIVATIEAFIASVHVHGLPEHKSSSIKFLVSFKFYGLSRDSGVVHCIVITHFP